METVLGLLGIVAFIAVIVGLAAGVTYAVIRLTPNREAKQAAADESPAAAD